ncbi:TetR/AcrR family transcriptional regulator [Aeromicrobium sp. CF4.19]|uniref:TetR/AcrR family transcriptional regulator n=1 Tax=Aeromicrobium sp. CF4.19 TaxID=3373082 RepID=UPI003EE6C586
MPKAKKTTRELRASVDSGGDENSKSSRTRARILEAAAIVLKERGYASCRLSDVAAIAEIQAPALYYYFKSREELIEEVVTIGQKRVFDHVTEVLEAGDDLEPIERISLAVRAQLEVTLRDSHHASAAIRTSGHLPPEIRARQLVEQRKYGELWRQLIAAAVDAGQINEQLDTSSARLFALGALNWVPEWWDPKVGSLEGVIANAQAFVLHGLRG